MLCADVIAAPLKLIRIACFSAGVIPEVLKLAKILSIFLKASSMAISNYRPLFVLPVFSKIFEMAIHKGRYAS